MAKVKFPVNTCKVFDNCKDPKYVTIRFSNGIRGNTKMLVIKRYCDGGYLLRHANIYNQQDSLYRVTPDPKGSPWSTYTMVPAEEGGGL